MDSCRTAQLKPGHGFSNGAAGSLITPMRLKNVGHETCSLEGYPRIRLLNRDWQVVRDARGTPAVRGASWS